MKAPRSLRGKMVLVALAMLATIGAATLYTGIATAELARSLGLLFSRNQHLEDIKIGLAASSTDLTGYLSTRTPDDLSSFFSNSDSLAESAKVLNRAIREDEGLLLQRELAGLIDRYLESARAAAEAKGSRSVEVYTSRFEDSEKTAALARSIIERVESRNLAASIDAYSGLNSRIKAVIATNAALVVAAVLMAFMIFLSYTWAITGPLSSLAAAARAIEGGDYESEVPHEGATEEIATMANAFERMRRSVRAAFDEQRAKAEIERRLIEEELRLVDMDRKLKDAELLALQAQINPHFLFNTLAAGMQLALSEGADRSADFMDKLAAFIRYALRSPSRLVGIADEIECVELYVWLLRLRFGERFSFSIEVDDGTLGIDVPALILQPLVENSVGHGLRDVETGGIVRISARLEGGEALLEVADNGAGMEEAVAERLIREAMEAETSGGEGGIGLHNVIRRLSLATGGRAKVEMESAVGRGTLVRIRLPAGREDS
ncbi:MAG TPA: histidine kinase [Rectinemataceae bacterium]|nr:histidine kinase [Rectinemataceae bacterium]